MTCECGNIITDRDTLAEREREIRNLQIFLKEATEENKELKQRLISQIHTINHLLRQIEPCNIHSGSKQICRECFYSLQQNRNQLAEQYNKLSEKHSLCEMKLKQSDDLIQKHNKNLAQADNDIRNLSKQLSIFKLKEKRYTNHENLAEKYTELAKLLVKGEEQRYNLEIDFTKYKKVSEALVKTLGILDVRLEQPKKDEVVEVLFLEGWLETVLVLPSMTWRDATGSAFDSPYYKKIKH